jgi:hypothetical protein
LRWLNHHDLKRAKPFAQSSCGILAEANVIDKMRLSPGKAKPIGIE